MKKQLSTAMAAAMALGSVVPVFADSASTYVSGNLVNERLANGLELVKNGKVFTRQEVYNYNGAKATERDKHTLKSQYANCKVVALQENKNGYDDLVVLAKTISNTTTIEEQGRLDTINKKIAEYKKQGYTETVQTTNATITTSGKTATYTAGEKTVTLTKKNQPNVVFTFENVDNYKTTTSGSTETVASLQEQIINKVDTNTTGMTMDTTTKTLTVEFSKDFDYKNVNRLKYNLEKMASKISVVKDEITSAGTVTGYDVTIKDKTAKKNTILNIKFIGMKEFNSSKMVNLPAVDTTDFKDSWAKEEILESMLSGYVDVSKDFRPTDSITRAEFAKIVCTVFGLEVNTNTQVEPFNDVADNAWYAKYIAALYNAKGVNKGTIINGYEDGTFRPNDKITRQEAAKIIASAYTIAKPGVMKQEEMKNDKAELTTVATAGVVEGTIKVNGTTYNIDTVTKFKDDKEIATWADASVLNLVNNDVIKGYEDNTFKPGNTITRQEALAMLVRTNN